MLYLLVYQPGSDTPIDSGRHVGKDSTGQSIEILFLSEDSEEATVRILGEIKPISTLSVMETIQLANGVVVQVETDEEEEGTE